MNKPIQRVATVAVMAALAAWATAAPGGLDHGGTPARPRLRAESPDGRRVAEVRRLPRGGETLWLDGQAVWPERPVPLATRVVSGLSWSRRGDALAFVSRHGLGSELVIIILDAGAPSSLAWPLPPEAGSARTITWLGPNRVGVGSETLQPRVVASWN